VADDHRPYHELELVDHACGEQGLRYREAGVHADVATSLLLEIPNEFDQTAVDHLRVGPLQVERQRRLTEGVEPLSQAAHWHSDAVEIQCLWLHSLQKGDGRPHTARTSFASRIARGGRAMRTPCLAVVRVNVSIGFAFVLTQALWDGLRSVSRLA